MNKVPYAIPKQNEGYVKKPEDYAEERVKELCDNIERVRKNAKLVGWLNGIEFENKFVILLDEGYVSFLIGLYHSTVSICSIAMERLCYDLVENSQIQIDGQELSMNRRNLFLIFRFSSLLVF